MAKTKWTRRRRLNMDTALLVNSKSNIHKPAISRVDNRYYFLEENDGIGSVSLFFTVNDFALWQGDPYFIKLIGSASDDADNHMNGWQIFLSKIPAGPYAGITFGFGVHEIGTTNYPNQNAFDFEIKEGITYHLVMVKIGQENKCYLNAIEGNQITIFRSVIEPTQQYPITLGGYELVSGLRNTAIISLTHVAIFNQELTHEQVTHIYKAGGLLPVSTHASCVGYWTCQESLHSSTLIDTVEQFNHMKDLPGEKLDFSPGGNWSESGGSGNFSWANGELLVNNTSGQTITYSQATKCQPNHKYKIRLNIKSLNSGSLLLAMYNSIFNTDYTYVTEPGLYEIIFTVPLVLQTIQLYATAGTVAAVDELSITPVAEIMTANHGELLNYSSEELGIYQSNEEELLQNGDFASSENWVRQSVWTLGDGKAAINGGSGFIYQDVTLAKGGLYKLTFRVDALSAGTLSYNVYSFLYNRYTQPAKAITAAGEYSEYFFLPPGKIQLGVYGNDNCTAEITVISLKLESETDFAIPSAVQGIYEKEAPVNQMLYLDGDQTAITFESSPDILRTYNDAYTYYGYLAFRDADVISWGSCFFTTTAFLGGQANGLTIKYSGGFIWVFLTGNNAAGAGGGDNLFKFTKPFTDNFFAKPRHIAIRKSAMKNGICTMELFVDGQLYDSGTYTAPAFPAPENISPIAVPRIGHYIGDWGGYTCFKGYYGYIAFSKEFDSRQDIENAARFQLPSHSNVVLSTYLKNVFSLQDLSAANRPIHAYSIKANENKEDIARSERFRSFLPEQAKAVLTPSLVTPINLPKVIPNLGNENFSLYFTVHFNKTVTFNNGLFYQLNCSGAQFEFYKGRLLIFLSHIYYLEIALPDNLKFSKGFYSICIQKIGEKNVRAFINGRKAVVANVGTGMVDAPYMVENEDISLTDITTNQFFSNADDMHLVNYGIYKGNLTERTLVEMYNNSLLNNPVNLSNWLCYYQFNLAGTSWKDQTGNCADAYCTVPLPVATLDSLR